MSEFSTLEQLQELLEASTTRTEAERILRYLTDWNKSRPMPAAEVL